MTGTTVGASMVNEVRLVGRLSAVPEDRVLPSGDRLTTFRVVVDRPPRSGATRREVDTIDCVATRRVVVRSLARVVPGDLVEVDGALHRRFWRGPSGPASRHEVEVRRLRRAV